MCSSYPSAMLTRELYAISHGYSEILNPAFRPLVRHCYTSLKHRKLIRTRSTANEPTNPVYDLQYSPVSSGNRMLAVADEHGYLSVINVPYHHNPSDEPDPKQTALMLGPYHREDETAEDIMERLAREAETINPVLYTLDWCACGSKIATGYGDGTIRMWDLTKRACYANIEAYNMSIKRVCWRNEAPTCVLSCSRNNAIELHDLRMRVPLVNRINCAPLSCKLTDISVIDDNMVLSCSSNSPSMMVWDLRHTYKLYKRVIPVDKLNVGGRGLINMKYDGVAHMYGLCDDGVIRKVNWRTGTLVSSFKVPSSVDFFTKIDICDADVMVCGSTGSRAFGFDTKSVAEYSSPFFTLNEGAKPGDKLVEEDKENEEARSCCAVAISKQRGSCDVGFVQIATGGDDSAVTVWD